MHSLQLLLRGSLAVAHAHARDAAAASAAAADVLLQPLHPEPVAGPRVDDTAVHAAVQALHAPAAAAAASDVGSGDGATGFGGYLRECGGDAVCAAVCVAADDVRSHERACGMHGPVEQRRRGEARRAAWEVQVHAGIRGR